MHSGRTIAVIDVGSNSVRLLVARELTATAFEVVDEERFDARIGLGQEDGALTADGIERGAAAMRLVSQVAAAHCPTTTVAVGTEALRRAPNAAALLDRIRADTGLSVRTLSTDEEAFASFLGVVNSTTLRDGSIVDIGGGSLELIEVRERRVALSSSAPLGALYASERFLRTDRPTAKEVRALRKAVRENFHASPAPVLYGVGGAVRNLARMLRLQRRYPLRRLHGLTISRRDMSKLVRVLAGATADERRRLPGVSSNRADILHAAAIVVDEVMDMSGAEVLSVSGQGLREGLVWQELRGEAALLPDVRAASIAGLARANNVEAMASEPDAIFAAELFAATRPLHGLDADDLDLLLNAARLSGIGLHIDYYDRDRHAAYLVHSGDLHGFTHREIVLLAAVCRWADGGTPDLDPYASLIQPDDTRRAGVLAALLGLARSVRRRSPSPVLKAEISAVNNQVCLTLHSNAPLDAELVALGRQQRRFEGVLRTNLVISVVREESAPLRA